MSADIQGAIADWLHARDIVDNDGFGKRAASAITSLKSWDVAQIRDSLSKTATDLFRRNAGIRKSEVCDELAARIVAQCQSAKRQSEAPVEGCEILFFAANPQSTTQLDLAEEARAINQKIRAAKYRGTIRLVTAWATRPDDLLQYLNEHDAQVVHFSGHGSGNPGLVMQYDAVKPALVTADALGALFAALRGRIRLVVLNACDSLEQAKAIANEIDCVIGMRLPIGDEAARVFAASLYRAIGFGTSIQEAFDQGKAALKLQGIHEHDTPVLVCRKGVNPATLRLISG